MAKKLKRETKAMHDVLQHGRSFFKRFSEKKIDLDSDRLGASVMGHTVRAANTSIRGKLLEARGSI